MQTNLAEIKQKPDVVTMAFGDGLVVNDLARFLRSQILALFPHQTTPFPKDQ